MSHRDNGAPFRIPLSVRCGHLSASDAFAPHHIGMGSAPWGCSFVEPPGGWTLFKCVLGGVLLSRTLAGAVPSALSGLASGFGMGPGVSLSL